MANDSHTSVESVSMSTLKAFEVRIKGQSKEAPCSMIKSKYADSYTVCLFIEAIQGVF